MDTREYERLEQLGRANDPVRIAAVCAQFGLELAAEDDIRAGRAIAARLISDGIASAETFIAMQKLTGASVFVLREDGAVTGMLGFFILRAAGLKAIEGGTFDAIDPDWDMVALAGETPAAVYGWGFAATTERGGRAAVKASVDLHRRLFWGMPTFTRTATPDGVRVILGSMGYRIYREDDPTLVWIPASPERPVVR
jgi:hypothetical protein